MSFSSYRCCPLPVFALLCACLLTCSSAFAQTDVWLGGTGNWSDGSKWSAGVPTATSNVLIDNGNGIVSAVTVNGGFVCNNLTIDAEDSLTITSGNTLTINGTTITNAGQINVTDSPSAAFLSIAAGHSVMLTGGGTITLNDVLQTAAALINGGAGSTLTNVNNKIQGSGSIGQGGPLAFVNQAGGVVNGNQAGRGLVVSAFGGVTNQGLMGATSGGALGFSQSLTVNNSGGTISSSGSSSLVSLIDITQGGTLKTSGGGAMQGEGTLDGATHGVVNNQGTLTVPGGQTTTLTGTINNTGIMVVDDTGGPAALTVPASQNVTLTGGGTITLIDATQSAAALINGGGSSTLTNVNNTIQGSGSIGQGGSLAFVNQASGVVNANQSGHGLVVSAFGGVTNQGLIEATSGGSLSFSQNLTVNNAGGTISSVGSGSLALLINVTQGGTLTTSGGGVMQGEGTLDGTTHGTLNNQGTFSVPGGQSTTLIGSINNTGTLVVDDTNGNSSLSVAAGQNVTLTGGGTLMMNDATNTAAAFINGGASSTLTNVNNKIQGSGQIGQVGGLALVNQKKGVINASQLGHGLLLNPPAGATNQGLMEATNGSTLATTTPVSNSGKFSVAKNSLFQVTGPFANFSGTTLTGGTYMVTGTLQFMGANIVNDAASITLTGVPSAIIDQSSNDGLRNFAAITSKGALALHSKKTLVTPGSFSNAGKLTAGAGTKFTTGGAYTQTGGTTTVDGTLTAPTGTTISGGKVFGKGTIAGTVVSSAAFTAGDSPTKTGKLSPGTYTQNANGSLNIAIAGLTLGTQYGQLAVTNGANLNGTLNVTLINNFLPAIGNTFTILTCSARTTQFATVNGLSINGGEHFEISYGPTSVTLTVASGP
jgi:hypothetical protein